MTEKKTVSMKRIKLVDENLNLIDSFVTPYFSEKVIVVKKQYYIALSGSRYMLVVPKKIIP
jgi:hypothetical protein